MQNGLLMCFWGIILGIVYLAMGLTGKNFFSAYMDFHPILGKKGFKYVCTTFGTIIMIMSIYGGIKVILQYYF